MKEAKRKFIEMNDRISIGIIGSGAVFVGEKNTDHQSCTFPGVCVLPSGRWISICRAAPTKKCTVGQYVLLSWSDDEGRSWREPFNPFLPPCVADKPGPFSWCTLDGFGGTPGAGHFMLGRSFESLFSFLQ